MEGLILIPSTRNTRLNNNAKESSKASTSTAEVEKLKSDITAILNNGSSNDIDKLNAARERMLKFYNNK